MPKAARTKSNTVHQMSPDRSMNTQDKTETIRNIARKLYEQKGCQPGRDLENWLEAEKLVKSGKM